MDHIGTEINTIFDIIDTVRSALSKIGWDWDFDPKEYIIDKLVGDWNSLAQKGEVLKIAGDAAEGAADDLRGARNRAKSAWDGEAAEAFYGYMSDFAAALAYDGPLNRVVGEIYIGVAALIKWGAKEAAEAIAKVVEIIRKRLSGALGWAETIFKSLWGAVQGDPLGEIRKIIDEIKGIYQTAVDVVDMLSTLREDITAVIEAAQDPLGALEGKIRDVIEEKTAPAREKIEQAQEESDEFKRGFDFAGDLYQLSNTGTLDRAPDEGFDVGDRPREDGDWTPPPARRTGSPGSPAYE